MKLIFERKNKKLKESMEQKEKRVAEERERLLRQLNDFEILLDLDVVNKEFSKLSSEKEKNTKIQLL